MTNTERVVRDMRRWADELQVRIDTNQGNPTQRALAEMRGQRDGLRIAASLFTKKKTRPKREEPRTCSCGYLANSKQDLAEHAVALARGDDAEAHGAV